MVFRFYANSSTGDEDYYYFKYCEEEWDIWESGNFNKIKDNMSSYLENNHKNFSKILIRLFNGF